MDSDSGFKTNILKIRIFASVLMCVLCVYRYTKSFYTLLVPSPSVIVNMLGIPTVGQPLSMECIMTTVRGITGMIDIIWSRDGVEVKRTTGASITSSSGSSIMYKDFYNISLVTTNEEEKVYQCRGVINATLMLTAENNISLDLVGKYIYTYIYIYIYIYTRIRSSMLSCATTTKYT